MNFDYTLYLVTDRQLMNCDSLTEAVEQAILGGCTMIQLREKELSSLEFYNQAVAVKQVTDKYHIPLIINDRIDIAMAVQATGVHIGQHDLPAAAVRKVIGEPAILLSGYFLFTTPVLFPSVMILTQLISKVIPEGLILLSSILLASVIAGICP